MRKTKRRIWMVQKRLEKDLTQIELAKKVNVSNRTISEIERGTRYPSGKLAKRLADVLEVEMEMFYKDEDKNEQHKQERGELALIIKNYVWKSLSPKQKFDLLLKMSNMNVLGSQVVKDLKKNKPYNQNKQSQGLKGDKTK